MRNLWLLSLLAVSAAASAADFKIDALTFGGSTGILNLSGVSGMNDGAYYAGPFNAHVDNGSTIRVFCADLLHETVFNATQTVSIVDTATMDAGYQKAAQLLNKFGGTVGDDAVKNGALQAAIWKSIFPTVAFSDGTAGTTLQANTYLDADLTGVSTHANYYSLGGANQSMLGAAPVPEPASIAALGAGTLGLLRRRRRA